MAKALLILAVLLGLSVWEAHGAPPPGADGSLSGWFQSLQDPNTGGSCCGEADCRHYPVAVSSAGYSVFFHDEWLKVPERAILQRSDNPGDYVTCIHDWDGVAQILCFIRRFDG